MARYRWVALTAGVVLMPMALVQAARGQSGCSLASLKGPYGIQASGTINGVPAAFVGEFSFDGQGQATGAYTYNIAGEIDPITGITGTYTIDDTCRGSAVIHTTHHSPPSTHFHDLHLVVVDGGREALFETGGVKPAPSDKAIQGVVLSGTLKRL